MLRTRDLVLFVLVILFLVVAITATLVKNDSSPYINTVTFTQTGDDKSFEGSAPLSVLDRQSVIERLRTKLQNSTERIEPSASVEAPVQEEVEEEGVLGLQKCLYPDDSLAMVPQWPLTGVSVKVQEGARAVFVTETIVVPAVSAGISSSSPREDVVSTVTPLLQLPLVPSKLAENTCVPSEVVGVTSGGVLMFNGDINSYRKIGGESLIGYARDGFPIYGVYTGEVDQCGGYEHSLGYRYTISTERNYIVGCFVGVPALFTL